MATTAVDTAMVATDMAVATTARGLLMPSLRLMLLLRLSLAMATTAAVDTAMVATDMAVATTARGRLRLSLATAMAATAVDMVAMVATAMVVTVVVMVAMARGLLSPVTAMVA